MHGCVGTSQVWYRSVQTDQTSQSGGTPAIGFEIGEDGRSSASRSRGPIGSKSDQRPCVISNCAFVSVRLKYAPKHDDKSKEAEDVDNCHNAFHERQLSEEHGIGEDTQK